jgi:hypothetical protein
MSFDETKSNLENSVYNLNPTSIDTRPFPDKPRVPVLNQHIHEEQLKKVLSQNKDSNFSIETDLLKMENVPTKQEIRRLLSKPE